MELHHNTHLDVDFSSSYADTLQHQLQNHTMRALIQITILYRNCAYQDVGGKMGDHIHHIHTKDTSSEEASFVEGKDMGTDTFQAASLVEDSNTSVEVIAVSIVGYRFFYYSPKQAVTFGISLLELSACDSFIASEVSHSAS